MNHDYILATKVARAELMKRVVNDVIRDAYPPISAHLVTQFAAFSIGNDFDDDLGRFAKLPDEVAAILLLGQILVNLDVEAEHHVRDDGLFMHTVEQTNIGENFERTRGLALLERRS